MTEEKKPDEGEVPSIEIEQIANLNVPSRKEIRRPVYIGGKLTCQLESPTLAGKADIVDLSTLGCAVVIPIENTRGIPKSRERVVINFNRKEVRPFKFEAEVRNMAEIAYRKSKFLRIGMRFLLNVSKTPEDFHATIGRTLVSCHPFIRPQVMYRDPFFFNERVICHVNSFTHDGIELLVPMRTKTMFPGQSLDLQIYIPGHDIFRVTAVNSPLYFQPSNEMVARYMVFTTPSPAFLEAVSQYLVAFQNNVTPNLLRREKFKIGSLLQIFSIDYSNPVSEFVRKDNFAPTLFARPVNRWGFILPFSARPVSCHLGDHFCAIFGVLFVDRNKEKSLLAGQGHKLSEIVLKAGHVEIVELFLGPSVSLADCFLPILQQVVRIATQASVKYICFEASPKLAGSLKKIGLFEGGSTMFTDSEGTKISSILFELDLTKVLPNDEKFIPELVWNKVYGEISDFLGIGSGPTAAPDSTLRRP